MKEIYILEDENSKKIYLIEDDIILERHEEVKENPMLEGNIYVGKVNNVLPRNASCICKYWKWKKRFYTFERYTSKSRRS